MAPELIARFVERSVKPSARLEGRAVPDDYERLAHVEAIIAMLLERKST